MGISGHCSEAHCSEAWSIGPRRVGPRHGDLVRGMGPFGPRHGNLVRGMFGPRHGPFWSEARSGNGPWDRLGVTVRYTTQENIPVTRTPKSLLQHQLPPQGPSQMHLALNPLPILYLLMLDPLAQSPVHPTKATLHLRANGLAQPNPILPHFPRPYH